MKKLSEEQIQVICTSAANGMTLDQIAALLMIAPQTLDLWIKNPAVVRLYKKARHERMNRIMERFCKVAEGELIADKSSLTAMIFYLKTQARWTEQTDVSVTVTDELNKHDDKVFIALKKHIKDTVLLEKIARDIDEGEASQA